MAAPLSCDQYEELLGDSLLHAIETEAVSVVTEHLSTCDRCRTQGTAYEAVLDQLAQAVPQQDPPMELERRSSIHAACRSVGGRRINTCKLCTTAHRRR